MIRYIQNKYLNAGTDIAVGRKKAGTALSLTGAALNILLFIIKATAGYISGSIAITADGFNNLADTGSCLLTLLGFTVGNKKPCRGYPFGYGRIEYLSGLLISAAVTVLGIRMMISSVIRMISPDDIDGKPTVLMILLISVAVKGYMYLYNSRIGSAIDSAGMKAAALDSLSDCIATAGIIISIIIENITGLNVDGYAGALVAACIIWAGIAGAKESAGPLLGRGVDEDTKERIESIAKRHRNVMNVYGIAVHDYGPQKKLLSMYITVSDGTLDTIISLREEIRNELGLEAVISAGDKETEQ